MWRDQVGWYIGVIVTLIGALATIQQILKSKRDRTTEAKAELAAAFEAGRRSRDDEVDLIRSQRDDARRDRDGFERERDASRQNETQARRDEADARRTLAMMQRPIADYELDPPPHRPQPGSQ